MKLVLGRTYRYTKAYYAKNPGVNRKLKFIYVGYDRKVEMHRFRMDVGRKFKGFVQFFETSELNQIEPATEYLNF